MKLELINCWLLESNRGIIHEAAPDEHKMSLDLEEWRT